MQDRPLIEQLRTQAAEQAAAEEERVATEAAVTGASREKFIEEHKQKYIDELAEKAKKAQEEGSQNAELSRQANSQSHAYSIAGTMDVVREYFEQEGFTTQRSSVNDGRINGDQQYESPTYWAEYLRISW